MSAELDAFCEKHPFVIYWYDCLGRADFEIGLDAPEAATVAEFIQTLYMRFEEKIDRVRVEPLLNSWPSIRLLELPQ